LKDLTGDDKIFLDRSNGWYKLVYIVGTGVRKDAYGCSVYRCQSHMQEYVKGLINGIYHQMEKTKKKDSKRNN